MSWTKLDDLWGEQIEQAMPDEFADRWHYLQLIQYCSRVTARDGVISITKAERISDHPDPRGAITRLASLGLVTLLGKQVKVLQAAEHVIPEEKERNREYQRRSRAHREGDHQHCLPGDSDKPGNCRYASPSRSDSQTDSQTTNRSNNKGEEAPPNPHDSNRQSEVSPDPGTGRDGHGRREDLEGVEDFADPETGEIDSTPSRDAPKPSELFGDPPVSYEPVAYDTAVWNDPPPIPSFARRSNE